MPMSISRRMQILLVVCERISFIALTDLSFASLALLDIPVYESRVQSLHALFSLYLGFKNSEVRARKTLSVHTVCFLSLLAFQSNDE
jgi:hypothetical protein